MDVNPYQAPAARMDYVPEAVATSAEPLYFPVSILKLVVMCLATFGLYELVWFHNHWKRIKEREGRDIAPVWRAIFGVFYCHQLFRHIRNEVSTHGIPATFEAGTLATLWILLTIAARLPDPWWLVTFGSVFTLIPVQRAVNELNAQVAPSHDRNDRFTTGNIVAIVLGVIFGGLVLVGLFISPE